MKRTYRLPDGTTTYSSKTMTAAWLEFARPIEEATGVTAFAFDPGIYFRLGELTVSLPTWFIKLLNETLKSNKEKPDEYN